MIYTYERVSTTKQDLSRQTGELKSQLKQMGITKIDKAYQDKCTGKNTDRPELQLLLKQAHKNDIIYCESISRLGRNLKDLIDIIDTLTEKDVRVVILKEGIDTANSTYKLLLAIFGGVAEMERETIQERVQTRINQLKEDKETTGIINTKTGKWFGGQQKQLEDIPKEFYKYYDQTKKGQLSKTDMAKIMGIGRATLYRWIKLVEENKAEGSNN